MFPLFSKNPDSLDIYYRKSGHISPNLHQQIEFVYILYGTLALGIGTELFQMEKGDFAVIFPGQIHHTQVFDDPENCASMYLLAPPQLAGSFQEVLKTKVPVSPLIKACDVHEDIRYALHALYRDQTASERLTGKVSGSAGPETPAAEQEAAKAAGSSGPKPAAAADTGIRSTIHAAFIQLLLCRALPLLMLKDREDSPGMDLAARVSSYLEDHFKENITLSSLARALYVSPYSVSRIFSSAFRTNFNGYLNDIRVEYVCEMLRRTDKSVTEIYEDAGFESQRTFNRAFRERMRMSPREFRESGLLTLRPLQDTGR
ncbi:MAG: AraC family transcriptional regulator [Firmicutes bacterium]|nr:AraC family transcriptional regulator [Bacillota bacterium]